MRNERKFVQVEQANHLNDGQLIGQQRVVRLETVPCGRVAGSAGPGQANSDDLASFVYAALQGAILQSKVEHSAGPLKRFKKTLFAVVLQPAPSRR